MSVVSLTLRDVDIDFEDPEIAAAVESLYPGVENPFPLVEQELVMHIEGINSAMGVAVTRAGSQEMTGNFLHFVPEAYDSTSTEKFTLPEYMEVRIPNFPLRHDITQEESEGVEIILDARNETGLARDVLAGELKYMRNGEPYAPPLPFFNPTTQVTTLNPGKMIRIAPIKIVQSTGRRFAAASVVFRARSVPTDLEELPYEKTHCGYQGDAQRSGYTEDPLTLCPANFKITMVVRAAVRGSLSARQIPLRIFNNIHVRLRVAQGVVKQRFADEEKTALSVESGDSYWKVNTSGDTSEGVLHLRNETTTITQIIKTAMCKNVADLIFVGSTNKVDSNAIQLIVARRCSAEDLTAVLVKGLESCIAMVETLRLSLEKL
jgi:hypothetical protein